MKGSAGRWLLTAAMLVAGVRLWMQVRGKTKTPFDEWVVGWGVTFFFLSILAEAYPGAAGSIAGTIVVGDFLINGETLFEDLSSLTQGAETGQILSSDPFAASSSSSAPASSTVLDTGKGAGQTGPTGAGVTQPGGGGREVGAS